MTKEIQADPGPSIADELADALCDLLAAQPPMFIVEHGSIVMKAAHALSRHTHYLKLREAFLSAQLADIDRGDMH